MNYYEVDAMFASAIKAGAVSMLNMEQYFRGGVKATAAMTAGTMRHMAVLEPDRFDGLTIYDGSRNANAYRALVDSVGAENIITPAERESHIEAVEVLKRHDVAMSYLNRPGTCEKECYWTHDGHPCKAKIDKLCNDGTMIEYKTTGQLGSFQSTALRMHYHLQLGWYWRATNAKRVVAIAQEIKPPYDVAVMTVRTVNLKMWYNDALAIAERWWAGERSGAYPEAFAFELPSWYDGGSSADSLELDDLVEW